jgi:hypothetical protein
VLCHRPFLRIREYNGIIPNHCSKAAGPGSLANVRASCTADAGSHRSLRQARGSATIAFREIFGEHSRKSVGATAVISIAAASEQRLYPEQRR